MVENKSKKSWLDFWSLFAKIETKDDALTMIKNTSTVFLTIAGIQGGIGIFIMPALLFDVVLIATLAFILRKWQTRSAAIILLIWTSGITISTFLRKINVISEGGKNIELALLMLWAGVRATEATFKLHGKFAKEYGIAEVKEGANAIIRATPIQARTAVTTSLYAGFWKRLVAIILDWLIVLIISFLGAIMGAMVAIILGSSNKAVIHNFVLFPAFLLPWLYFALMESSANQATLGKMALGIKVVDLQGIVFLFGRHQEDFLQCLCPTLH